MKRTKAEAAETRASILEAAERLFFERGVDNSALDDIAAAAGVTRGAIYWHFNCKSDLFLRLYNEGQLPRVNMTEVDNPQCGACDALAAVEEMACQWLETLASDPQRQRLLSILIRTNFTGEFLPVLAELQKMGDEHECNIEAILEEADRNGQLASNWTPKAGSRAFVSLIKGLCWEWLLFGKRFDIAADGSESIRCLVQTFRKQ